MSSEPTPSPAARPVCRRWPAILVLVLAAAAIIGIWLGTDLQRQFKVMLTAVTGLITLMLLGIWLLFLSRLAWKTRLGTFGLTLALLSAPAFLFRFGGVTGDLVPILQPRWNPPPAPASPASLPLPDAPPSAALTNAIPPTALTRRTGDFPQFLGPDRTGVLRDLKLDPDWTAHPPALLWRQPIGEAWSGFAVVGNRAVTQEQAGPEELVTAYDLATGQRLWTHAEIARYENPLGGVGPRATPTLADGRVYALGATGILLCLELESGQLVWRADLLESHGTSDLEWGMSSSPLVLDSLVIVAPRGLGDLALLARNRNDGSPAWQAPFQAAHYSSPRLVTLDGVRQILTFNSRSVSAHAPDTGAQLWSHPWKGGHPHISEPCPVGTHRVLISSGYGTGSELIEVARTPEGSWSSPRQIWRSLRLRSKFAPLLVVEPYAYGLDDGRLACIDLNDGSRRWQGDRYGHGQLLRVDPFLLVTAENGDVVLADAQPDAFRERARFHAIDGKTWNPPALAGDLLLVRNHLQAAAYRLPLLP